MAVPAANSGLGGIARSELLSVKDVRSRYPSMLVLLLLLLRTLKHSSIEQRNLLMES